MHKVNILKTSIRRIVENEVEHTKEYEWISKDNNSGNNIQRIHYCLIKRWQTHVRARVNRKTMTIINKKIKSGTIRLYPWLADEVSRNYQDYNFFTI